MDGATSYTKGAGIVVESRQRFRILARVNLRSATETLAGAFAMSRDEAQRTLSGEMLEALLSHGYAKEKDGRYAVSERGERMLRETEA